MLTIRDLRGQSTAQVGCSTMINSLDGRHSLSHMAEVERGPPDERRFAIVAPSERGANAVVQVPTQPPALLLPGSDQPLTRALQLHAEQDRV